MTNEFEKRVEALRPYEDHYTTCDSYAASLSGRSESVCDCGLEANRTALLAAHAELQRRCEELVDDGVQLRRRIGQLERERDEQRSLKLEGQKIVKELTAHIAAMQVERDEARAEVERLKALLNAVEKVEVYQLVAERDTLQRRRRMSLILQLAESVLELGVVIVGFIAIYQHRYESAILAFVLACYLRLTRTKAA